MTFEAYRAYFENIVNTPVDQQTAPYDNPDYIDYTNMNWLRMNRWFKTASLSAALKAAVQKINAPQTWIVITEPWCGDAAHNIPFIDMAARVNPLIQISYELRDSAPFRIADYLTNGTKSIPKLIIRNQAGEDLGTWGPRPEDCQGLYQELLAEKADFEKIKIEIQTWYNANKGRDVQTELTELIDALH